MILTTITAIAFLAQDPGPVADEVTIPGLAALAAGNGLMWLWNRQLTKDRDREHDERVAAQAKAEAMAERVLPLLASAVPALDKVTESMQAARRSEVDELRQMIRGVSDELRDERRGDR